MVHRFSKWLDERTGLISGVHHFLDEDIPSSAGWHQVFGSVALFAFLLQIVSGLLLAVNYAPTPGEAWDSLRYIVTQVTAGSIIRSMHHWGASLMIIIVVLHMAQTFIWGAYKKPRETTWIVGVLLLLLTLAFGLSGYLLAWDNRAYWGTVVTAHITSLAPGGALLLRALGTDGSSIGRVTFARFYAAHVTLLPIITLLLVLLHVILVRRHGVTPTPGDEALPKGKFFPSQVFKDTVAVFAWFIVLALMVAFVKVPLGHMADPTDLSYNPRPEWYFLFLFQFLKLFNGSTEVIGAVVLPGVAVAALALMPFIDRRKAVRITQRTGAIAVAVLAAIAWTGLTARAVATTPPQPEEDLADLQTWQTLPPSQLAAVGAFRQAKCASCHSLTGASAGPDIAAFPSTKPADWLTSHFQQPAAGAPASNLSQAEIASLIQLTTKRTDDEADAWQNAPDNAVQGALIYQANGCSDCHTINGEGGQEGPVLNGLRLRHDRTWVEGHFADPPKFTPGSEMPGYTFNKKDLDTLTTFVMSIPKQ